MDDESSKRMNSRLVLCKWCLRSLVLLSAGVYLSVCINDITWHGYNAFLIDCKGINNGFSTIGIITYQSI